ASLAAVLGGRADIPAEARREVGRLVEDLTASYAGSWYSVISLHGGGSPEAMKREIWRNYPVGDKVDLVERLLDRGVAGGAAVPEGAGLPSIRRRRVSRQPGRCCDAGCDGPPPPV
ncbi:MAG TPA: 4-hydroxyphenylacetate 3-hydroxylase C-terminal domain-containing protein, partial [Acidimicrobiia bacterium]|nr:4-hydroxyphenylacetate 3-hydroxylase C-terminal domain-containing protein [Acidimicrobiia bacterium]